MLQVLNQQVNVVSTHLHNLELTQQGEVADLPDSEEIANDAAAAEEMLAKLQADNELADSVGTGSATLGLSEEEAALYAELEAESNPPSKEPTAKADEPMVEEPDTPVRQTPKREPARRVEPEAG